MELGRAGELMEERTGAAAGALLAPHWGLWGDAVSL